MLPRDVVRGRQNPLHFDFAVRLKRARKAAKLTRVALARLAGLTSPTSAYTLEQGNNVPRVDTVERLARALNLSPCFLAFGVEQFYEPSMDMLSAGLSERLLKARQALGLSLREVGRRSETSGNLVSMMEQGSFGTLGTIEKLAQALHVTPCWLAYGLGQREASTRSRQPSQPAP